MTDTIKEILAAIGLGIGIVSYIPYLRDIFRGRTRPHVFSWFVWGLLTAIACAGQVAGNGGAGSAITALTAFALLFIALLALKYGEKSISRSDWIFFIAALAAIPLWLIAKTPLYAMLLVTLIDAIAFYPTFRKSWIRPQDETLSLYILAIIKFIFSLAALQNYTIVTVIYPASWIFMNIGFVLYVLWRRYRVNQ